MKIMVANRGEIAIRIMRAAAELNIPTLAIYSEDDANSLHTRISDESHVLNGRGVKAYLDIDHIIEAALANECTAIHPGYGFLSENPEFAERCTEKNITFIGPAADQLELFGNKSQARNLALECDIPLLPGSTGATSLKEVKEFFNHLGGSSAIMIKALAGGGGRGMRAVYDFSEIDEAFNICQSEALAAFGNGDLYAERLIKKARHIEIQIVGDGTGAITHLWERECTLQRQNQKMIEVAPSPTLSDKMRRQLTDAAVKMAKHTKFKSLGTFEFLVDEEKGAECGFYFLEVNPRIQVEHTVTEEVMGIDLVKTQIRIANGATLAELGLDQEAVVLPSGYAIQSRINMEQLKPNGAVSPSSGVLVNFDVPMGPGIRVDTFGYRGYQTNSGFDSLLAKLIVHSKEGSYSEAVAKAYRALCEFRIDGITTNIPVLQSLLTNPEVKSNRINTRFIEEHLDELLRIDTDSHQRKYFTDAGNLAEGRLDQQVKEMGHEVPENCVAINTTILGTVVEYQVAEGDEVYKGQSIAILEAMKMQHLIKSHLSGVVRHLPASVGETLNEGAPLLFIEPMDIEATQGQVQETIDLNTIRPDLQETLDRYQIIMDEARPKAVKKRHSVGFRTARENVADLVDQDSFMEYGAFAVAAQRGQKTIDKLIEKSPADGLITGIGSVNGDLFDDDASRCIVMSYDYTAMAGTQGAFNHKKSDRMLYLAHEKKLPLILFAEGGGGRTNDIDQIVFAVGGLHFKTFGEYARLSGLVPTVGIVNGVCFAGNAALLGCNDVIIATRTSYIGMGGPAMIEGGGLGTCKPEEIGPIEVQSPNGVVDIVVEDETEAVEKAKQYLSYFQGSLDKWSCADQRELRAMIPENRLRAYDVRKIIETVSDTGSVLEIRSEFGAGMVTSFVRIEGKPFGLVANNSQHMGGAIDAEAADTASRFVQLCDAFDIPLIVLMDTPGFMVGPEAEKQAQVRRFSRLLINGANIDIPIFNVVLRKGYGLGALAMAMGNFHRPFYTISWPTGEFGGMGLEGMVRLGFKEQLKAEPTPEAKAKLFDQIVASAYAHGKANNTASYLEVDAVIDPMETRQWLIRGLKSMPKTAPRTGKKRQKIEIW